MNAVLEIGDHPIPIEEIIPLLTSYQMLPQLMREIIIDRAIASITCTSKEVEISYHQFWEQNQLNCEVAQQAWMQRYQISCEQSIAIATRPLKIEKFKQANWGRKLESYFLERKGQLDKAVYSLLIVKDVDLANELYFRIQAGEQSFGELAQTYSLGQEALTLGINGPVMLGNLHPGLAQVLAMSQPGQLWSPMKFGEWIAIVRLEKLIPAQLDESMRQQLLNELFESWIQEQTKQEMTKWSDSEAVPHALTTSDAQRAVLEAV